MFGGYTASEGQFPYQVSIRIDNIHHCGGSIISNFWILTVGHCVFGYPLESIRVVVGTNHIAWGGYVFTVVRRIIHEGFYEPVLLNDIALLRVAPHLFFNRKIQPIRLGVDILPTGTNCVTSGWGWIRDGWRLERYPDCLQYIQLHLVDIHQCKRAYIGKPHRVVDTNICGVNGPGTGTCHADSGGPLVCNGLQYGIVSTGDACAKGTPDVFTSIYGYRRWIALKTDVLYSVLFFIR